MGGSKQRNGRGILVFFFFFFHVILLFSNTTRFAGLHKIFTQHLEFSCNNFIISTTDNATPDVINREILRLRITKTALSFQKELVILCSFPAKR